MEFKVGDKVKYKSNPCEGTGVVAYIYDDGDIIASSYIGTGGETIEIDLPDRNLKAEDRYILGRPQEFTLIQNSRIPKKYK